MRDALYARISEDRSGEAAGVGRQIEDARALSATRGGVNVGEYIDNDLSALTGKPRPRYQALIEAVIAGHVDRIVVWQTSRLWRNRRERAEGIEILRKARVSVLAVRGPELDLSTATGRAMAGLIGEFDTMEGEIKGERIQRAAYQRAMEGGNHGGRRAFGYASDGLTLVPEEAAAVRWAYEEFLAGATLGSIARRLQERGIPTVTGGQWIATSVRDVLRRPRYAGLSEYHGEVVGRGQWPAIVTEDMWRLSCAMLRDPSRRTTTGNRAAYLLSGLARCGVCKDRITSGGMKRSGSGTTAHVIYRCRPAGHVGRRVDWVDDYVTRWILERLAMPDAAELLVDQQAPDFEALSTEARALHLRLDEAAAAFAEGEITRDQLRVATEKLRSRIAQINTAMTHTSRAPVLADLIGAADIRAAWESRSLDRQRAVVAALVEVTIHRAVTGRKVFDPSSVEISWK